MNPTYRIVMVRYIPRAVIWYFCFYLWYKFLLTAYKIEIDDNIKIKTISLFKEMEIKKNEIESIEEGILSVNVIYAKGKVSICTLIDGIGNIKNTLLSLAPVERKRLAEKITATKILLIIILTAFAIYVEFDHFSRLTK